MRPLFDRLHVLSALLLATAALASAADGPVPSGDNDFRQAVWGQTRQQVRNLEGPAPTLNEGPLLVFPATVSGEPCQVIYMFRDDKLCMGFYQWSDTHDDLAPYFDDAAMRRDELSAVLDEPQIEKWDWEDPMFEEDPTMHAEALGLGLVRYELGWMSERSIVALRMSGGNLKADILVMYADRTCFPSGQEIFGTFFADTIGLPSPYYR